MVLHLSRHMLRSLYLSVEVDGFYISSFFFLFKVQIRVWNSEVIFVNTGIFEPLEQTIFTAFIF